MQLCKLDVTEFTNVLASEENLLICTVEITQLSPLACFNHTVRTNFFCNFRESNLFFSPYRLKDSKNQ